MSLIQKYQRQISKEKAAHFLSGSREAFKPSPIEMTDEEFANFKCELTAQYLDCFVAARNGAPPTFLKAEIRILKPYEFSGMRDRRKSQRRRNA